MKMRRENDAASLDERDGTPDALVHALPPAAISGGTVEIRASIVRTVGATRRSSFPAVSSSARLIAAVQPVQSCVDRTAVRPQTEHFIKPTFARPQHLSFAPMPVSACK